MEINKEIIRVTGETLGLSKLDDKVCQILAAEVEHRIREVLQEAVKFQRRCGRDLNPSDINHALKLKNMEPIYGLSCGASPTFRSVPVGETAVYYYEDPEIDINTALEQPLPQPPKAPCFVPHWLAVNGEPTTSSQPSTASKVTIKREDSVGASSSNIHPNTYTKDDTANSSEIAKKSNLPTEFIQYFCKCTDALMSSNASLQSSALRSLRKECVTPLVPCFVEWIDKQVPMHIHELPLLLSLIKAVEALSENANVPLHLFLHQLVPPLLTCTLGDKLSESDAEDHWTLRDKAATALCSIALKYGDDYKGLFSDLVVVLMKALLDDDNALSTRYGALVCLSKLGPTATQELLLQPPKAKHSRLVTFAKFIVAELTKPAGADEGDRHHQFCAAKCYGVLLDIAGQFLGNVTKSLGKHLSGQTTQPADPMAVDGDTNISEEMALQLQEVSLSPEVVVAYNELYAQFGEGLLPYLHPGKGPTPLVPPAPPTPSGPENGSRVARTSRRINWNQK